MDLDDVEKGGVHSSNKSSPNVPIGNKTVPSSSVPVIETQQQQENTDQPPQSKAWRWLKAIFTFVLGQWLLVGIAVFCALGAVFPS
jgi:hypothetical protein